MTDLASTSDLLRRAREGDSQALDDLIRRHQGPLRRWARGRLPRWTRDLRDTEDLVQETLTQTLRPRAKPSRWSTAVPRRFSGVSCRRMRSRVHASLR